MACSVFSLSLMNSTKLLRRLIEEEERKTELKTEKKKTVSNLFHPKLNNSTRVN